MHEKTSNKFSLLLYQFMSIVENIRTQLLRRETAKYILNFPINKYQFNWLVFLINKIKELNTLLNYLKWNDFIPHYIWLNNIVVPIFFTYKYPRNIKIPLKPLLTRGCSKIFKER